MENQMSPTISTISDEVYDAVFVFKLFSKPRMLENLKNIEGPEVFTELTTFCNDELKVCILF